jgi:hypothetical protein
MCYQLRKRARDTTLLSFKSYEYMSFVCYNRTLQYIIHMWFARQIMHIKTSLKVKKKRRIEDNNIKKIEG